MAKLPHRPDGHSGKVKVRIIEFEMEGSDLSLQESLKSIAAALSRPNVAANTRPTARLESTRPASTARNGELNVDEERDENEYEEHEMLPETTAPIVVRKPRKPSKPASPNVVAVRFDDVSPTFVEFVADRDPKNDKHKYLCAAFWLKFYKEVQEVSIDHIYTAYRSQNWALPTSPVQPMRELAARRDGRFSKGVERGHYSINHIGEGYVTTKMGSGA
ncbi:hypothetical protein [Pseudomonas atacamensis]|uniref:hypothetical protein n=1 Tax=Pseudomonas atacamensis TaxID=2565368 RepID=UPI0019D14582|nr:hypothetical protein [Pseudomonas atacamensis]QSL86216.1 hypothetical protein JWU58_18835 [Pseudomonas atacamensis]